MLSDVERFDSLLTSFLPRMASFSLRCLDAANLFRLFDLESIAARLDYLIEFLMTFRVRGSGTQPWLGTQPWRWAR